MHKISRKKEWRKHGIRIMALTLALLMVLGVVVAALISTSFAEGTERIELHLTVLEDLDAVNVTQKVEYRNETGQNLTQMFFQLAPNAFRRESTAPYETDTMIDAYPDGFTAGGVEFRRVEVNGQSADWGVEGTDEATLRVACNLETGEKGTFEFEYELLLPYCAGMMGVGTIGWRLTGFYPLPAVWDGEFVLERLGAIGDSLLALPTDYSVRVNAPAHWTVASAGALTAESAGNGRTDTTIELSDARYFALSLSKKYTMAETTSQSGIQVLSYANDLAAARRAADGAARAADVYAELFGDYPRDTLVIAQADLMEGMSQSGMVLLPEELYAYNQRGELEFQTALWTAHQWFTELAAANPAEEPWLGESLSVYAALRYYEKTYGYDRYLKELNARYAPSLRVTIPGGVTVNSEALAFGTVSDFDAVVRGRGAAVLHELRVTLGESELDEAIRAYLLKVRGRVATETDFASALRESSGRQTDGLLEDLLMNIDQYVGQDVDWYE